MSDPLAGFISLLQPRAVFSRVIGGAGPWAVAFSPFGLPSFCTVLEGRCQLAVKGQRPIVIAAGDFVLLPATPAFTMASLPPHTPPAPVRIDPNAVARATGEVRYGRRGGKADVRQLGGYFAFDSPDADLLVSLLPPLIHLRGAERLGNLVRMLNEEAGAQRPGRELVLGRLVDVLLIEALRANPGEDAPPGLLRGLADARVATAMRCMHGRPQHAWTVAGLAREAALSRSAFYERFTRAVGMPPMTYLLSWRMALAKNLLRQGTYAIAEVAERVGYGSSSTFSTAFSRMVGEAPGRYGKGSQRDPGASSQS